MKSVSKLFFNSVMNYINLSLFVIIGIAMLNIFISFWISEKADSDARAINLSGTMRMQMYHIGLALYTHPEEVEKLITQLDETWFDPLFDHLRTELADARLNQLFYIAQNSWTNDIRPELLAELKSGQRKPELLSQIDEQVARTNQLVNQFEMLAEEKIRLLRTLQFVALILTTLIGSLIFYLLRNHVETPLRTLTHAAKELGKGNIDQHISEEGHDELSDLARAFNQMRASIKKTLSGLEGEVQQRTQELQRNNTIVTFLYTIAQQTISSDDHKLDYIALCDQLSEILENQTVEICLFTAEGDTPYYHIGANSCAHTCNETNCNNCIEASHEDNTKVIRLDHHYAIENQEQDYGVLTVHNEAQIAIEPWQDQLLRSFADQIAIALALQENMRQEHRFAMLSERTVIARELHDSLAQSLSYLQIQVTRLQKAQDKGRTDLQGPIMDELREGLSNAYRHLRELLTTFRLKLDGEGLRGALKQTITQLSEQTNINIELDYALQDIPLNPSEEIHLLQIVREACQNAINHSQGQHIRIALKQDHQQNIELSVEDDGIGLPDNPEKLNHYGLAIIHERSRHLGGNVHILKSEPSGVKIALNFTPTYIKEIA